MPQRVQRKRVKGWSAPEGAVYVGRGSKWGNPYRWDQYPVSRTNVSIDGEHYVTRFSPAQRRAFAVGDFENGLIYGKWLTDYPSVEEIRRELAGKDLMCWCPEGGRCHADVLLKLANGSAPVSQEGGNQ